MIKVKHLLDTVEKDDGQRLWIEPIGLTKDLGEWCQVDHVLKHLGPNKKLWDRFENHPDEWESFRGHYHEALSKSQYRQALIMLAGAGQKENFTLLHQGSDPNHNTAAALHEFLNELTAFIPPEGDEAEK
ncbi:MAG TPA: DUF488 family protein [Tepidisphaeraceae bacterium]|jgi:uncharacterized protein YeaO (DUF488 family)